MKTVDEWIDEFAEPVKDFDREAFGKVIEHIRQEQREACLLMIQHRLGEEIDFCLWLKIKDVVLSAGKED